MSETTKYEPGKHGPIRITAKETGDVDPKYLEREPFFTIDDEEFTILKNPSPALGMKFLDLTRQRGEIVASAQMFDDLVQPAGALRRLSKVKNLQPGTAEALMAVVADKLTGLGGVIGGN